MKQQFVTWCRRVWHRVRYRKQNARIQHIINHATVDTVFRDAQQLRLYGIPVGVAFGMLEQAILRRREQTC